MRKKYRTLTYVQCSPKFSIHIDSRSLSKQKISPKQSHSNQLVENIKLIYFHFILDLNVDQGINFSTTVQKLNGNIICSIIFSIKNKRDSYVSCSGANDWLLWQKFNPFSSDIAFSSTQQLISLRNFQFRSFEHKHKGIQSQERKIYSHNVPVRMNKTRTIPFLSCGSSKQCSIFRTTK